MRARIREEGSEGSKGQAHEGRRGLTRPGWEQGNGIGARPDRMRGDRAHAIGAREAVNGRRSRRDGTKCIEQSRRERKQRGA